MNQKKAKNLRKALRKEGVDVTIRSYNDVPNRTKKDADGRRFVVTGTMTLTPQCGRAIYKKMKSI